MSHPKLRIGISIGDYNSISPEILLKTFSNKEMFDIITPVVYTCKEVLNHYQKTLQIQLPQIHIVDKSSYEFRNLKMNLIETPMIGEITEGKPTKTSGDYAFESLKLATADLKEKKIDALVTLPLSKENINISNSKFTGHTGYLEEVFQEDGLMLMCADELKVGLATEHLALSDVSTKINETLLRRKVKLLHSILKKDFLLPKPKIAVLSLNPHAGDNGKIGKEEIWIKDCLDKLFEKEKLNVWGPFSSDGFFGKKWHRNYDATLALYHDQGMIPFKILDDDRGVNYTSGLSAIRTSPSHGTAFDIAGKNIADPSSFREAIFFATSLCKNRRTD